MAYATQMEGGQKLANPKYTPLYYVNLIVDIFIITMCGFFKLGSQGILDGKFYRKYKQVSG